MVIRSQSAGSVSGSTTGSSQALGAAAERLSSPPLIAEPCPIGQVAPLPLRAGHLPIGDVIDLFIERYEGRDPALLQRLAWWNGHVGTIALQDLSDDHVHAALQTLEQQSSRYYAGKDAGGKPIYKAKRKPIAPATINRYAASLAALVTWTIKQRIAPRGYVHPVRSVTRRPENNERVRFLNAEERERLLQACHDARWPRLHTLVLMALTTGARKSEMLGLRWRDVDLARAEAHCGRTKNGEPRVLPLVEAVVEQLRTFAGKPEHLVFASARNTTRAFAFEEQWKDALARAGVRRFRFHDLRHSCASMLAASGASLLEVAEVLGHKQLAMTKRYAHLTTQHKAALVGRVMGSIR